MNTQDGGIVLGMMVMMLVAAGLLLQATRQQLDMSLWLVIDERQHIIDFYHAQSALNWGQQQKWAAVAGWQCRTYHGLWRACFRQTDKQKGLLRGSHAVGEAPLTLWRWMETGPAQSKPSPHGWIDLCPLPQEVQCEP